MSTINKENLVCKTYDFASGNYWCASLFSRVWIYEEEINRSYVGNLAYHFDEFHLPNVSKFDFNDVINGL